MIWFGRGRIFGDMHERSIFLSLGNCKWASCPLNRKKNSAWETKSWKQSKIVSSFLISKSNQFLGEVIRKQKFKQKKNDKLNMSDRWLILISNFPYFMLSWIGSHLIKDQNKRTRWLWWARTDDVNWMNIILLYFFTV